MSTGTWDQSRVPLNCEPAKFSLKPRCPSRRTREGSNGVPDIERSVDALLHLDRIVRHRLMRSECIMIKVGKRRILGVDIHTTRREGQPYGPPDKSLIFSA